MQIAAYPVVKDVVLVGGGHAHVTVLKKFAMRPLAGLRVTLISPDEYAPYSGMLPGLIAGHYTYDEAHIDLRRLCRYCGAVFIRGEVTALDRRDKTVAVHDRPPISYDLLSINAGSTPDPGAIPGATGRVLPVKPVSEFLQSWQQLKQQIAAQPDVRIGVVGAGAGGVELILSAQFAISRHLEANGIATQPSFHVVTRGDDILETHNDKVRAAFRTLLERRGIEVITGRGVDRVSDAGVHSGSDCVALDHIFWVTGAQPPAWLAASGLELDARGFMRIDETLRATNDPSVFGAGDNADMVGHPRPKSGVFAVRQGPPLATNLRAAALEKPLRRYRPQKAFLSLISTGERSAVVSWRGIFAQGELVWTWKDWIDRRFMAQFNDLPEMSTPDFNVIPRVPVSNEQADALGDLEMRCGGCAAKLGADALAHALMNLPIYQNGYVRRGLIRSEGHVPDDAAVITAPTNGYMVQSVDMFRAMIDDPFVLGMIAANHSLGDLFAMGASPQSALAVVALPVGLPAKNQDLLHHILQGAVRTLNQAGCELAGGHTSEAAELSVGFVVTGTTDDETALMRKSGMKAGDRLILTKPLGTGILFAGDMRAKAEGRWVQAAIECALQSNMTAAEILMTHGARACTDITGFGLAGHAAELAKASELCVRLKLSNLPVLDGVTNLLAAGIVSSLHAQNRLAAHSIGASGEARKAPHYEVLFDPQTAGGLLASVPEHRVAAVLCALNAAGYSHARDIGWVLETDANSASLTVEV